MSALLPDLNIARQFAKALTAGQENPILTVRLLYERNNKSDPASFKIERPNHGPIELAGTLTALWPQIEEKQEAGYAAYVVINKGNGCGGKFVCDGDIRAGRAFFIDADDLERPNAFHLEPDFFVVRDKTHWHAYWVEPTEDVDQIRPLQSRLATRYHSDPTVCNPSRIMRLPGSLHLKGDKPILITFEENPNRLRDILGAYGVAELAKDLPPASVAHQNPVKAKANIELDEPQNVGRAKQLLADYVRRNDVAVEGRGGDNRTYQIAAEILNLGLSPEAALEIMFESPWNAACQPPWGTDGLRVKIENASQYAQNEAGAYAVPSVRERLAPALDALLASAPDASGTEQGARNVLSATGAVLPSFMGAEIGSITPPRWLIAPVIPTPAVGIIFGQYGSFKTTTATGIVDSILTGIKAFGFFTAERGDAVLIAGEGLSGLKTRIEAQARNHGRTLDNYPLLVVAKVPRVDHPDEWAALVTTINARGLKPKIIFIDHLSIMLAGQDQNDATVATQAMQLAHELSMHFGCTVIVLAHAGKDGERQVRGSSAFLDNVDFAYELTRSEGSPIVKVRCAKMRDGEAPEPFFLRAESKHGAAILTYANSDDARRASGKAVGLRPGDVGAALVALGACPGGVNAWMGETGGIPTRTLATEIAAARHRAEEDRLDPSPQEVESLVTMLNRGAHQGGPFEVYVVRWKPRQWAVAPGPVSTGADHA